MTTIILGLIILSCLWEIYTLSELQHRRQVALSHIQNNAQTASEVLISAIHQAGDIGCARLTENFPVISYQHYSLNNKNKLSGTQNEITVRYMEFPRASLQKSMHDYSVIDTTSNVRFKVGDIVIISDCHRAEIFKISSSTIKYPFQKIISQQPLHHLYMPYAEVGRLIINKYFVAKTNRNNGQRKFIDALYEQDFYLYKNEIVEGIQQMQISYVVQTSDIDAKNIGDWSKVIGVNIKFLVSYTPFSKPWYLYANLS